MELATLPWSAVECGLERRFQAAVGVGGDEIRDADAALLESVQKVAPVHFRLGEGAADAKDDAFAIVATNPVGDESGTVADDPVDADFVVGGIKGHGADRRQGAVAPFSEFGVELLVEIGDLVGAPPHWQPIPLRSIGCQCGGPMPRADFYRRIFTLPFEPN